MAVKFEMREDQVRELKALIAEHKKKPGPLMPTLHDAQHIFGCIPIEVQKLIAEELGESVAKINGVVTFYSRYHWCMFRNSLLCTWFTRYYRCN